VVNWLVLLSALCGIAAIAACEEGAAHDQSGSCVIDPYMPPPFLGFEYWEQVGIALSVLAAGVIIAVRMLTKSDD